MSKGTKQFRAGRLERLLRDMEIRKQALDDTRAGGSQDEGLLPRIDELTKIMDMIRNEFELSK